MDNRPIAFFDSGIGGSTILKEVIKALPNEKYIYYPDSVNNPYGNKNKDELFTIVDGVVSKLIEYNPKLIVCACNTATAMVLDDIRKKYPDIIFVGTEPAVKVVYDSFRDKNAIILTTKGTGDSEKFGELFNKYKTKNCSLVEAPLLAGLIENEEDAYPYLYELLKNYKNIDIVVLGCTHFPLVKDELVRVLGPVKFIDGGEGISRRVQFLLEKNHLLSSGDGGNLDIIGDEKIKERIKSIVYS